MKEKYPLVSIVAVNYNGKQYLEPLFVSINALDYPREKIEVIMVDNGSSDGSIAFVKRRFPALHIIKNDENNYSRANNLGIRKAKGEYIALVNNDVEFDKDWLKEIIAVVSRDKKIGIATGKILFPDGRIQSTGHYEMPQMYWSDRGFREEDSGQYNVAEEVSSVSHCAALYRRKCLDDIGLLDEDFNIYMEDVDMCLRAKQNGWKTFYCPKAIVLHKFHGSIERDSANLYCERNRLLLIAKHYPDKLGELLFGQGYFTVLGRREDLGKVISQVLIKLKKHHGERKLYSLLPDIILNMGKVFNLEKDYLVKTLDGDRAHLKGLEDYVKQKEQDIASQQEAMRQKDNQLQQLNARLAETLNSVSEKTEESADKDNAMEKFRQALQKSEKEVIELNIQLTKALSSVSEKTKESTDKERVIEKFRQALQKSEKEAVELDARLAEITGFFSETEKQLSHKEEFLRKKELEAAQLNAQLSEIKNSSLGRDKQLSQNEAELLALNSNLKEMISQLAKKDSRINSQELEIQFQKRTLQQSNDDIKRLNAQLDELSGALLQKERCLREMEDIISGNNIKIKTLEKKIKEIFDSETYRIIFRPLVWPFLNFCKATVATFVNFVSGIKNSISVTRQIIKSLFPEKHIFCIAKFSASEVFSRYGRNNTYFIKVTNNLPEEKTVRVGIDIYQRHNEVHPDGHYAYFLTEINFSSRQSVLVRVDYDWEQKVKFYVLDKVLDASVFWRDGLRRECIYCLYAVIYDQDNKLIDKLNIYQRLTN